MSESDLKNAQNQAFESAESMRLVVDSIRDYAIFMLDPGGHVVSWNKGAEIAKGYRADEIIGKHIETFYTPPDRERGLPRHLLGIAIRDGRVENEGWRVRKDGTLFWADVIITALRDRTGAHVGFAKVTRDLTERRNADEERLKLARAEEAVRLRDEFLSIASHELKTPLTALKIQLDSLRERIDALGDKVAKKVERAARSGDRLGDLIESLLDVSRIATGRLALSPERIDLTETVKQLVDGMRGSAEKAGCTLTLRTGGPLNGTWDRVRIEQVVMNLLANAIRYAAGTPISLSLAQSGQDAVLEVSDGGPGIAEQDLPRIFRRFERAASSANYGGLGLGLYVSREIVEAHGGTIAVSNLPGGGARFTVRLPLHPDVRMAADIELH